MHEISETQLSSDKHHLKSIFIILSKLFTFAYSFLRFQIKYQADPDGGFRILEGSTLGMRPKDTVAVKKAKEEHAALFKMIAKRNQQPTGKLQS